MIETLNKKSMIYIFYGVAALGVATLGTVGLAVYKFLGSFKGARFKD